MIISIDDKSRIPAYEQIKNQIMTLILVGAIPVNGQLPSIRTIASEARLNINTVKKAFSDLESYGVIYTVPGKGSYVNENAGRNDALKRTALADVRAVIESARAKGVKLDELNKLINEIYEEAEK